MKKSPYSFYRGGISVVLLSFISIFPAISQDMPPKVRESILKSWAFEDCLRDYEVGNKKVFKAVNEYQVILGVGEEQLKTIFSPQEDPLSWVLQDRIRETPGWEKDYANVLRKMSVVCSSSAKILGSKSQPIDYSRISGRRWYIRGVMAFVRDKCLQERYKPTLSPQVIYAVRKIMWHEAQVPHLVTPYDMEVAQRRTTFPADLRKWTNVYLEKTNKCSNYIKDLRPMIEDLRRL